MFEKSIFHHRIQGGFMLRKVSWTQVTACGVLAAAVFTGCTSSWQQKEERNPASAGKSDGLNWESASDNEARWSKYCSADGGAASADIPTPNYKNALVKAAVNNFKSVAPNSLYPYPAILFAYGLKEPKNVPKDVKPEAHVFLTYLCGEFRDRATMVEAKLKWLGNFNKLGNVDQPAIKADDKANVWTKMSAHSYAKFLAFSRDLWAARQAEIGTVKMGSYNEPASVQGMTVCQTKYIFNEISKVSKDSQKNVFKDLKSFNKDFDSYSAKCSKADLEDYYDFRGDSNFKPNSPEGNGMIWYANHIASNCKTTKKAKDAPAGTVTNDRNVVTDDVCEDYFKNPFRRRWQAARAGLASWMMHAKDYDPQFKDDYSGIVIWPHRLTDEASTLTPFAYKVPADGGFSEPLLAWVDGYTDSSWDKADLNFNSIAKLGTDKADAGFTFERLRDAVNRHTNWYQSKWDDGLGQKNSFKDQAYSPFVASSYEPSESDQFTFCGITVPCPPDGFKHWMFVFRVKGKNWYRNDNVAMNGETAQKVDFSNNWFDETSLGTTGLADKEHAWDRMGTALEDELEGGAILYLHNISDSGEVSDDGLN
jgi:hypothetical protein